MIVFYASDAILDCELKFLKKFFSVSRNLTEIDWVLDLSAARARARVRRCPYLCAKCSF